MQQPNKDMHTNSRSYINIQLCHATTNVKRKFDGSHSNYAAVCIEFYLLTTPLVKKGS